jgi:ABC-2 family transporter protein
MIWLTWRQHRGEAYVIVGVLAALAALLIVSGRDIAALYQQLRLDACAAHPGQPSCGNAITVFENTVNMRYAVLLPALTYIKLTPALVGMLVGAPLVARELEHGTFRFVWTQSVTRWRWLSVKLGLVIGGCLLVVAALTALLIWWRLPFDQLGGRMDAQAFDLEGLVPLAYMAFALALAIAAGTLLRRSIPAMVVTIGGFFGVRLLIELYARPYYLPPSILTWDPLRASPVPPSDAWVVYDGFVDPHGSRANLAHVVTVCGANGAPVSWQPGSPFTQCVHARGWLGYIVYQPAEHFWLFQGIESAIFVGLAALLLALAIWWVRRRVS